MAPSMASLDGDILNLVSRQSRDGYCPGGYSRNIYGNCPSTWSYYGRWIFAAVVLAVVFILALGCACLNSRRRRRRGVAPMYGTGWMAPPPSNPPPHQGGWPAPPPAYGAPPGQSYPMHAHPTGNSTQGYYGGQTEGIQQPKTAYPNPSGAADDYAPPPGPPPQHYH